MASKIFDDAFLMVGGSDLSAYIESVEFDNPVEMQDDTTMGKFTRVNKPGLKGWSFRVTFHQDWANGLLDDLLWVLHGTVAAIEFRPDKSEVVGTNNPKYTGNAAVNYESVVSGGAVGTLAKSQMSLLSAGDLTRAEA